MPYEFKDVTSANAHADALAVGCTVVFPKANQLFVDIDDVNGTNWFHMNISKIVEHCVGGETQVEWKPSPSGKLDHSHVVVTLPRDVTAMERIAMQAFLGSDLKREALSWVRLVNDDPNPTLFFEKLPLQLAAETK